MLYFARIVAAVLMLLAVVLGIYAWLLGRRQPPPPMAVEPAAAAVAAAPAVPLFPIVVTTRAVPAGQPIAADAVRVAQLPIRPAGTFGTAEPLVGRVSVFDLAEGAPLFENHLADGLAQRIGEGERAVAVRADEVMGVGNRVQPGDYVDVFVVLKSDGREIDRGQARLLLARKRVLAFGSASLEQMPGGQTQAQQAPNRTEPARTAVLAIPIAEVNRLAFGESAGHLLLALRNPADMATAEPTLYAGVTASDFAAGGVTSTSTARVAVAAPPAVARRADVPSASTRRAPGTSMPGATEVEFIRGDRRETLTY